MTFFLAQPIPTPLDDTSPRPRRRRRSSRRSTIQSNEKLSASSLAADLQIQEEKRDFIYSFIAFVMKLGFLSIAISSLFNLGMASHHRIRRNIELSGLLNAENKKFEELYIRFDKFFTIGGRDRLMEEQDQWIEPNSMRIIWR